MIVLEATCQAADPLLELSQNTRGDLDMDESPGDGVEGPRPAEPSSDQVKQVEHDTGGEKVNSAHAEKVPAFRTEDNGGLLSVKLFGTEYTGRACALPDGLAEHVPVHWKETFGAYSNIWFDPSRKGADKMVCQISQIGLDH